MRGRYRAPAYLYERLSAYAAVCRQVLSRRESELFAAVLAALWFLPVLRSHYADGDAFYAHVSVIPQLQRISQLQAYAAIIGINQHAQGGWFPVAGVPLGVWLIDAHFGFAKDLQYLLIIATMIVFAAVAKRLLGSAPAAILAVTVAIGAWQFRMPHDPVIGTSLVTPWAALLTLGALWAWLHASDQPTKRNMSVAVALMMLAVLTGPVPWAVCAAVAIYALVSRKRASRWLAAAVAAASIAELVFGGVPEPWKHGGVYALNVVNQIAAALPSAYRATGHLPIGHVPSLYHNGVRYIDDRFINVPPPTRWAWLAVLLASAGSYFSAARLRRPGDEAQREAPWLVGSILWIAPAFMLGADAVWPKGLPFGQSFDGVYFEYFGIGLLAAVLLQALSQRARSLPVIAALTALTVFVACYGNTRADATSLAKSARADYPRGQIERAGTAGFFNAFDDRAIFAVSPDLVPANAFSSQTRTLQYVLYHYGKRWFGVIPVSRLRRQNAGRTWLLATPIEGFYLTAKRVASIEKGRARTDAAFGFTPFSHVAHLAETKRYGVVTAVTQAGNGYIVAARRLCGAVAMENAFAESRPVLVYGNGFFQSGPTGYQKAPQATNALGDVSTNPNMYAKVFMAHAGTISLYRTSCPVGFLNFKAVAVSAGRAMLVINQPDAKPEHIPLDSNGAHFWLRYDMRKHRSPIVLHLITDAPPAPRFDPIIFHYEHDQPRDIRLIFEPEGLWEDHGDPNQQ